MAEDEIDRADRELQRFGGLEEPDSADNGACGRPRACGHSRGRPERPRNRRRAAEMARDLAVTATHEGRQAVEIAGIADVGGSERAAFDEVEHECALLGVADRGRQAGRMAARRPHARTAQDHVLGDVAADADKVAPAGVGHGEVEVGDAACERLGGDGAGPDRQRGGALERGRLASGFVHGFSVAGGRWTLSMPEGGAKREDFAAFSPPPLHEAALTAVLEDVDGAGQQPEVLTRLEGGTLAKDRRHRACRNAADHHRLGAGGLDHPDLARVAASPQPAKVLGSDPADEGAPAGGRGAIAREPVASVERIPPASARP